MSNICYVEKKRYDNLLAAYMKAEDQLADLKKAWNDLRSKTAQFDDRVLEDIHRFDSLKEENAYIIGSFNTMLAIKYDIEELEKKFNAKNHKQQNSLLEVTEESKDDEPEKPVKKKPIRGRYDFNTGEIIAEYYD